MNNFGNRKAGIVIAFLILIGLIGLFIVYSSYRRYKFNQFLNSKEDLRIQLIEELKEGKINMDENYKLIISKKYDDVAKNNYVRSERCDKEKCVVAFLYSPGFPDEGQYLYYSSDGEKLIKKYDKDLIDYIKKIKKSWYFVQYR